MLNSKLGMLLLVGWTTAVWSQVLGDEIYRSQVRGLLDNYCVACHGKEKQKGDRRFDELVASFDTEESTQLWQDILDQLNRGEMPPQEAKQPPRAIVQNSIEWITDKIKAARIADRGTFGKTVLRRLNRTEYDRTVRQLLSLDEMLIDPTESFPPDESIDHFNNVGSALVTSDFLLTQYLSTAEFLIERAAKLGNRPIAQSYRFAAPFCPPGNRKDGLDEPGKYQHIRKNTTDEGGFLWLARFPDGVPESGWYDLKFKVQAINRNYPYEEKIVGVRKDEALRVAVVAGNRTYGDLEKRTSSDRKLAEFEVPDEAPVWMEARIWLDAGYQPRLTFPNGPNGVKPLRRRLVSLYPEHFIDFIENYLPPDDAELPPGYDISRLKQARSIAKRDSAGTSGKLDSAAGYSHKNTQEGWATFFRSYQGPRIRVFEIAIDGPIQDQWPPPSYQTLFGEWEPKLEHAQAILRSFASRAFRRPVQEEELQVLVDLVRARSQRGDDELNAIKAGLKAVLCSPSFLYLSEREGDLDDYALATRLSYFLWSSMPDDQLMEAAKNRKLREPGVLQSHAIRMLSDPKAKAFVDQFTSRWLQLYKIGSMPPDNNDFRNYYVDGLEESMKEETRIFFRYLLDENGSIENFLDADFAFLNGGLARLYGIPGITGASFRKVSLTDRRRGGLLGQASVHTASANGIDTSPVVRGIWVLENILGTPPNPPPPDVKPLEPDIRGAVSIRQQLQKHREVAACAECHRKIDPIGFAMENFDPIGGWRDNYGRGRARELPIDSSGTLPDGKKFGNIAELKKLLLERRDQFTRCLAEKLLTYGLGRTIEPTDGSMISSIVEDTKAKGYGLRDLVLAVVERLDQL